MTGEGAPKTPQQYFRDWEGYAFGFGYGSGEPFIIPSLRQFLALCRDDYMKYDYQEIETVMSPVIAWLLINILCRVNIIEYGTSPRYGWLTPEGKRLRDFIATKTDDELVEFVCNTTEDDTVCYPDACNCGPNGYEAGRICNNPFWPHRTPTSLHEMTAR